MPTKRTSATVHQHYKDLVAFSSGQATTARTLQLLGTDNTEDLFLLMAQAHLPMPRRPEAATQAMVQSLHQMQTTKQPGKAKQMPLKVRASELASLHGPVDAFRGSGVGGSTERLLAQRKEDARRGK